MKPLLQRYQIKRIIPFLFLLILFIAFAGYRRHNGPLPPTFKISTNSLEIREVVSTDTFKVLEAEIERYRKSSEIMKQHEEEIQRGTRYNKIVSGNPEIKAVAITFDDGPHPYYTPRLLAILKKYGVKATFFVVGKMAQRYPGLLKAEVADGHCIASHSYTHPNLTRISIEQRKGSPWCCGQMTPETMQAPGQISLRRGRWTAFTMAR